MATSSACFEQQMRSEAREKVSRGGSRGGRGGVQALQLREKGTRGGGGGGGGEGGSSTHRAKRRQRTISSSCVSPQSTFLAPHSSFIWYDADAWTEVAKYLDGRDLVRLGLVNHWFGRLVAEQSIWKHVFLRDLRVPSPHHVSFPWNRLYASAFDGSHSYTFRHQDSHIDYVRIGAFYLDSPVVLMSEKLPLTRTLPRPEDSPTKTIQATGACLLTNARTGIWIADLQLVRCPVCNLTSCEGTMQVLDTRHAELFLEEGFKDGSWEYEDIGSHRIDEPSAAATGAIFDVKYLAGPCTAGVLDSKAWMGKQDDWQPKARLSLHAVAVNTNLQPNQGLQVRFQAMRSTSTDGKVVSIRISQQLI